MSIKNIANFSIFLYHLAKMARFRPFRQFRVLEEVCKQLKQTILLSQFKAGDKLPSERDLVEEFQISRVTIREAMKALENSSVFVTRPGGNGITYVTEVPSENITNALLDLFSADKISMKVSQLISK